MENPIAKMAIADYRAFLTYYDQSDIRKIALAGSDLPSVYPLFRDEMARATPPETVLLSICVPSAKDILARDIVALLQITVGDPNHSPNIIWGLKEMPDCSEVRVTAYLGYKNVK